MKNKCLIETCERLAVTKGWCNKHYNAWRRNGDPIIKRKKQPGRHKIEGGKKPRYVKDREMLEAQEKILHRGLTVKLMPINKVIDGKLCYMWHTAIGVYKDGFFVLLVASPVLYEVKEDALTAVTKLADNWLKERGYVNARQ